MKHRKIKRIDLPRLVAAYQRGPAAMATLCVELGIGYDWGQRLAREFGAKPMRPLMKIMRRTTTKERLWARARAVGPVLA